MIELGQIETATVNQLSKFSNYIVHNKQYLTPNATSKRLNFFISAIINKKLTNNNIDKKYVCRKGYNGAYYRLAIDDEFIPFLDIIEPVLPISTNVYGREENSWYKLFPVMSIKRLRDMFLETGPTVEGLIESLLRVIEVYPISERIKEIVKDLTLFISEGFFYKGDLKKTEKKRYLESRLEAIVDNEEQQLTKMHCFMSFHADVLKKLEALSTDEKKEVATTLERILTVWVFAGNSPVLVNNRYLNLFSFDQLESLTKELSRFLLRANGYPLRRMEDYNNINTENPIEKLYLYLQNPEIVNKISNKKYIEYCKRYSRGTGLFIENGPLIALDTVQIATNPFFKYPPLNKLTANGPILKGNESVIAPEATASETMVPETATPETTVPETVIPETATPAASSESRTSIGRVEEDRHLDPPRVILTPIENEDLPVILIDGNEELRPVEIARRPIETNPIGVARDEDTIEPVETFIEELDGERRLERVDESVGTDDSDETEEFAERPTVILTPREEVPSPTVILRPIENDNRVRERR